MRPSRVAVNLTACAEEDKLSPVIHALRPGAESENHAELERHGFRDPGASCCSRASEDVLMNLDAHAPRHD